MKLVSETGEALKAIKGFIIAVNQHMNAIATSARELSAGLSEVNMAVNQMDQVTQQNAAMVEETIAASATLATESTRLRQLIGRFELGGLNPRRIEAAKPQMRSAPGSQQFAVSSIRSSNSDRSESATVTVLADHREEF